jgi:hypothetical protein
MYDVELHNLYSTKYFWVPKIKEVEIGGYCGSQGTEKNTYRVLVEINKRNRLRGTSSLGGQLVTKWILKEQGTKECELYSRDSEGLVAA